MSAATVFVFGATSAGGRELCRRLVADGVRVVAAVRAGSDGSQLEALGVECRQADAMVPEQVRNAMRDLGAQPTVVSLLGGMLSRKAALVDSQGNINAIDAAKAAGARRFVMVTSVGCNESRPALVWVPRMILRHVVREKGVAETYLKDSGLAWTIIRPGRLTSIRQRPSGLGILIENPLAVGPITRADLGELVYRAVTSERAVGKIYAAADRRHAKIAGGGEVVPARLD